MSKDHEQLDVYEMERMVAKALIALVDGEALEQRITPRLLSTRTGLPLRRVREVTDAWELQTLSGDAFFLGGDVLDRVRKVLDESR